VALVHHAQANRRQPQLNEAKKEEEKHKYNMKLVQKIHSPK
jgi:hypothetical protein